MARPATVVLLALGMGSTAAGSHAASCQVRSPAHTVALVELYTSQGCSSCPPADRWLSTMGRSRQAAEQAGAARADAVVPLSLHVNYWDYIGWKDPYAQQRFTDRQYLLARQRGASSVYTPQVVLSGADYRRWGTPQGFERDVAAINQRPARAVIDLTASGSVGATSGLQLRVKAVSTVSEPADLYVAVFESRLGDEVTRGENAGTRLTHDYVVRTWAGPVAVLASGALLDEAVKVASASAAPMLGVAAFVQTRKGEVLQAIACQIR